MIKIALVDDDSDFIDYASKTIYKMLETDIVIDTFTTVDTFALAIKDKLNVFLLHNGVFAIYNVV